MNSLQIGLAQIPVKDGDVKYNLAGHLEAIELAARHRVDVLLFPELSLTGYELSLAKELAYQPEAVAFAALSKAAVKSNSIIIAGCPLQMVDHSMPAIAAVICFPDGRVEFYRKQYLHPGEERYCAAGERDYFFKVKGVRLALAICADFCNPEHAQRAKENEADLYLVSALISTAGYHEDSAKLSLVAQQNQLPVLLSNHISETGGWTAHGGNSVWNKRGHKIVASEGCERGILTCVFSAQQFISSNWLNYPDN